MKSLRGWIWAVLAATAGSVGCCSWCERNCQHTNPCLPANNCCQPCPPPCCPGPSGYQPSGWANPGGQQAGCCSPY